MTKAVLGALLGLFLFAASNLLHAAEDTAPPPVYAVPGTERITKLMWIDDAQFERQLEVVHGKSPDPNIGLFGPHSVMWRLNRHFTPAALGSGRALLLQIAHPWVTAAIDEHSITRTDPLKRGRNTFRYLLQMTYGTRDQAMQAARDVRVIHDRIVGHLQQQAGTFGEGTEYRANEVQAMIWVHATLWETLVMTYEQSIGPLSATDKERFYQETKLFAYLFGIPDEALPKNWDDFLVYCQQMRDSGTLEVTPATQQLADYLFGWHGVMMYFPLKYAKLAASANLPPDLREAYGLKYGPIRQSFFRTSLWMSRVGHKVTPGFITKNPVHKEAVARLKGKRASWWTRTQINMALGQKTLVNDYQ